MKIGLTISDNYQSYIEEIAKVNNMKPTTICGIILENWLQFNKDNNRYPIIQQQYFIKVIKKNSDKPDEPKPVNHQLEEEQNLSWNKLVESIESFDPRSED